MKNPCSVFSCFLLFHLAAGLMPATGSAESLPEYRPALLGHGKRSLINLIDVNSLVKRGQGNATVMFSCGVDELGSAGNGIFYRGTPDSDQLGREFAAATMPSLSQRSIITPTSRYGSPAPPR